MRLLVIDPGGDALDLCMRAQNAGHRVWHWMRNVRETEYIGRGLVTRVPEWQEKIADADLVFVSDNTHWLRDLDAWRDRGIPVFGCNQQCAALELDREFGQQQLRRAGVPILDSKTFTDYPAAIAYVKREMRGFASKPDANGDKALSYVAKTPEDLVYMLDKWKRTGKTMGSFMLQELAGGCEMAVGGFFGPAGFNEGWCENFEFKKFMNDNAGVNTGEQGTVLRFVRQSKLADAVLAPMAGWLEKQKYVGYIDVNCMIDDEGQAWPLEFTARPGWPTFNIQQALLAGDPVEWMAATLEGKDVKPWTLDTVALGVVLTIPDYPYSHATRKEVVGAPVSGLTPAIAPNVHPLHMMGGKAPQNVRGRIMDVPCYVTAGDYVLATTGVGRTILQAKKMAYRILKRLRLPNSPQYRTDIGDRLRKELPAIQAHGYAKGLAWDSPNA